MAHYARRLLAVLVTAVLTAAALVLVGATPAHAAAEGKLLLKGTGPYYTEHNSVTQGVAPGGTKSWSVKVVNTGTTAERFELAVGFHTPFSSWAMFVGTKRVESPYLTAPIAPGKSAVVRFRISVDLGQAPGLYFANLELRDPASEAVVDSAGPSVMATRQTGTSRNDLFLKTGAQPFVTGGQPTPGGLGPAYETASALKPGGTANFILRLKNNGGSTASAVDFFFLAEGCPQDYALTIRQGATDVTSAILSSTYTTDPLEPGAKLEFRIAIKQVGTPSCAGTYFQFFAQGPGGLKAVEAHVVVAAN